MGKQNCDFHSLCNLHNLCNNSVYWRLFENYTRVSRSSLMEDWFEQKMPPNSSTHLFEFLGNIFCLNLSLADENYS